MSHSRLSFVTEMASARQKANEPDDGSLENRPSGDVGVIGHIALLAPQLVGDGYTDFS